MSPDGDIDKPTSQQQDTTLGHENCAQDCAQDSQHLPVTHPELARIAHVWDQLPDTVRRAILTLCDCVNEGAEE